MTPSRKFVFVTVGAISIAAMGISTAPMAGATASSTDRTSVSLSLRPEGNVAAVTATLNRTPKSTGWATRVAALQKLTPNAGKQEQVRAWAREQGLTVSYASDWMVTVTGPAKTMAGAFDTAVTGRGEALHATSAPQVPEELREEVTTVGGLDNRPVFHPAVVPGATTPAELGSAYRTTTGMTGAGITVGTIQFSGWNSANLSRYASEAGIPLSAGQISTIAVGGANPVAKDLDAAGNLDMGALEVALDTQAILATAPKAKQRVYVATNDWAGAMAVYDQVARDAQAGLVQVVSESWGLCEFSSTGTGAYNSSYLVNTANDQFARITAAGATTFASSGDSGSYGCEFTGHKDPTLSVNFPASSTHVVAVGGTTLNGSDASWNETGWSGSGGGYSKYLGKPTWQSGVAGSTRAVPDVAAVADDHTGIAVYANNTFYQVGGTSLASPVWAGQLAGALSAAGRKTGVGSIHAALYAHPEAFRDITSGSNGAYSAAAGHDLVTGLGAPDWSKLGPILTGVTAPPTAASLQVVAGNTQRRAVGTAFAPVSVKALSAAGQPMSGVTVSWKAPDSGATGVVAASSVTNSAGIATAAVTAGRTPGSWTLQAGSGSATANFSMANQGADNTAFTFNAPRRIVDTRTGLGLPRASLLTGQTRTFATLGRGGVPSTNVRSVVLRVSVIAPQASGSVLVGGVAVPALSGRTTVTEVTVPAGNVSVRPALASRAARTQVAVDIAGYRSSAAGQVGAVWRTKSLGSLLDTRTVSFGAGATRTVRVAGVSGVHASASGTQLRMTVTGTTAGTSVYVWPAGQARPTSAVASLAKGQSSSVTITVPLGAQSVNVAATGGKVRLQLATGSYLTPSTVY